MWMFSCLFDFIISSVFFSARDLIICSICAAIGGNKNPMPFTDPENWNCAISYSAGSTSPLSPSFIFMLELARSKQVGFVQHASNHLYHAVARTFDKTRQVIISNGMPDYLV